MRRYLVLAVLAVLALGASSAAIAQDANDTSDADRIQSLVQPSIVYLETTYSAQVKDVNPRYRGTNLGGVQFGGDKISATGRCTGFFVHPDGWVGTAGHCVLPSEETKNWIIEAAAVRAFEEGQFGEDATIDDALAYGEEWFRVAGRIASAYVVAYATDSTSISSEETVAARLVGSRAFDKGDVGLLKFETRGVEMPGLELAEDVDVRVGTPLVAVGFPGNVDDVVDADYNPSFKNGEVSSVKTVEGGQFSLYEHDASVSGGMSGGPVVDDEGRVIGVTSRGTNAIAEGFDFAVPVSVLQEIMGGRVENDVGDVGRTYREGVEAFYDEKKSTAIDRFESVLNNPGNPTLALAADLLERSEALPDEGGFPWYVLLIGAAIAALAAGAYVLYRRRSVGIGPTPSLAGAGAGGGSVPVAAQPTQPPPAHRPAAETALGIDTKPHVVVVGERGETSVRFELEGEMVIGREATDILLEDEQVSRRHALIRVEDGRVELADLDSANGTEVNGERITERVKLAHGDAIRVGKTTLRLELPASMRGAGPADETVIA